MPVHHTWRILIVVLTVLVFITSVVLSALSAIPDTNGPFTEGESQLFGVETFRTKILPSTWAFASTWSGIYVYVFLALVYCLTTLCRQSVPGTFLYYNPPYLPVWMYVSLTIANIFSVVWLYLAGLQMLWQSLITYVVELFFLGVALLVAIFALAKNRAELKRIRKSSEIGWTIGLVHNGLGMYVTWVYFLTTGNLCSVMVYVWGVSMDVSCIVCLSLVAVELLGVFITDIFIWYEDRKYLYTPYVVAHIYLIGILTNNYQTGEVTTIYVFILLFLAVFTLLFKIGWCIGKKGRKDKQIKTSKRGESQTHLQKMEMAPSRPIPAAMPATIMQAAGSNVYGHNPGVATTFVYPNTGVATTFVYPNQIGLHVDQQNPSAMIAPQILEPSLSYPSEVQEQSVKFVEERMTHPDMSPVVVPTTVTHPAMSPVVVPTTVTPSRNPAPVYVCHLEGPNQHQPLQQLQPPLYPDLSQLHVYHPQPNQQATVTLGPGGAYNFS